MPNPLPNIHFPHSSRSSFPSQSSTPGAQQPQSGVRQDNPAPQHARIALAQPAPFKKDTRAHQLDRNTSRSQKRSNTKRKSVKVTVWVHPLVKAELQRLAEQEGLSVSKVGATFLEEAIRQQLHTQHAVLLQPIIEQAIRREMRKISTRLAWLLVRVAFDAGQTRGLVTNILGRQPGVTPAVLKDILDGSSKTAQGNITRKTPQLVELIEVVERWMQEEDDGKTNG